MRERLPLNLPLVIVVLSWGFNFMSLKLLYEEMPPYAVLLNRTLVMGVLLALVCKIRGESLRYPAGDAVRVLVGGFLALGLYMVVFLRGLELTTAAECAIMLATAPVFTFLLSCAFRQEPFTWPALLGSTIGFAGVVLVILGGSGGGLGGSTVGNLIVLLASGVWSVSVVVLRPMLHRYDPTRVFTLSIPGALPIVLGFGLIPSLNVDYGSVSPAAWAHFAQVTLLSGVVAFVCFYVGIRQIGPSRATMYQFFIPPTAAMFQWALTGRGLAPLQWVGLGVLLAGVVYTSKARALAQSRAEPVPETAP